MRIMVTFLTLASAVVLLLMSPSLSNSAEPYLATYDAATGSCLGAPSGTCDQTVLSHNQRTLGRPSRRFAGCEDSGHLFGPLVRTAINKDTSDSVNTQISSTLQANFGHITLDSRPSWVVSAAWDSGERHILMVDITKGSILRFDLNGHLDQRIAFTAGDKPAFIYRRKDGGYLIKDARTRVSWIGEDLASNREEADLRESSKGPTFLDSAFGLAPVGDNMLIFGDLKTASQGDHGKPERTWKSALVRTRPGRASCVETIHAMEYTDPARNFYLLGYPLLAEANNKGYALIMDDKPYILEAGFGVRRLSAFPPKYGRPTLPEVINKDSVVNTYDSIVRSKAAIGLIGWKDSLFILARQPARTKGTQWQLWKVDPTKDSIVGGPIQLPTIAEHIILVPGNRYWAIVEKGRVKAPQVQEVNGVILVPSSSFLTSADKVTAERSTSLMAR
jgi:hypothetical protein